MTISLPPDVERSLSEAARRDGLDVASLALQILLTHSSGTGMNEREARLVAQIHRLSAPLAPVVARRLRWLRGQNEAGALSNAEREEMLGILDAQELRAADDEPIR